MEKSKTSVALKRAIKKYDEKFERVNCRFPTGTKDKIKEMGYTSINKFIIAAVEEKLERYHHMPNNDNEKEERL